MLLRILPLLSFAFFAPCLADEEKEQPAPPKEIGPEFRTFTSTNGKELVAKVLAAFDDETYSFETPEGKTYRMARSSFCKSDRQWLEFWQPEFAVDLTSVKADEALEKMGYTAIELRNPEVGMIIEVTIGDADLKLLLDPKVQNTILDAESADRAGLKLTASPKGFRDANGDPIKAQQAVDAPFTFGDDQKVEATILVVNLDLIGGGKIQEEADGILGGDVLPKLNALLDFGAKTLYVKP